MGTFFYLKLVMLNKCHTNLKFVRLLVVKYSLVLIPYGVCFIIITLN